MSNPIAHGATPSMANFDEHKWVIQIRRSLEEEHDEDEEMPVCIFNVPKTLMSNNEEFYIPQMVAIGPYHHWRQDIYEMEGSKLAAAKRTQKRMTSAKFKTLVQELSELGPRIRGCYHKFLDFNGETLAWMMVVDLSFMLQFLQAQALSVKKGKSLNRVPSSMSHLVDYSGKKSAYNAILRDIIMLENQVPLFALRKMLEVEYDSLHEADVKLSVMLTALCKELSPFNMAEFPVFELSEMSHLLDFLYNSIVPKREREAEKREIEAEKREIIKEEEGENKPHAGDGAFSKSAYVKQLFDNIWELLGKLNKGPVQYLKKLLLSKPLKLLVKLPWTIISKLPFVSVMAEPLQRMCFSGEEEAEKPDEEEEANKPPSIEEIKIPSVTELSNAGVIFLPSHGDMTSINFDPKKRIFKLPAVSLDVNTEVVLRNLVAYEASTASGPLLFTRYTEFMNGIIDTADDAQMLREKGIVVNYLKKDEEVANLWNGMSKSVRLTRVPCLDKVIEDLNKYYRGRWKIKLRNFVRVYVFGSWKFLTLLAAIAMLILMTLQAFCSVYSCGRILRISASLAAPGTTPTD